jgi:hypothetical protein
MAQGKGGGKREKMAKTGFHIMETCFAGKKKQVSIVWKCVLGRIPVEVGRGGG